MLRERVVKEIKKTVPKNMEFSVIKTGKDEFGDYSSNVALVSAGKTNSRETAEKIKKKLDKSKLFSKVAVAGPGFINLWISDKEIAGQFRKLSKLKTLPKLNLGKSKKIQVEYVSANPTGPLTLANGRGGFLGDTLSGVLEHAGFQVESEYYVNDTGNQIITLGKSILASAGEIKTEETFYRGSYIDEWAKKNKSKIKKHKAGPLELGQEAANDFLKSIKISLEKKAGIEFDRWTSEERHIHKKGFVKKALVLFEKKNLIYKKEGALWLKTSRFNDDKDRVLMTSDGYPTYFLADAGHYLETLSRGYKKKINILGPDHYGYVARIQAVAEIIGMDESEIIVTQTVLLMKGKKKFKMSKRKGTFVIFEELIDEIGHDVARWFFLERSPDTHIDIDLNIAKKQSAENPVYYVQYAHARMSNILKKSRYAKSQITILQLEDKSQTNSKFQKEELKFVKKLLEVSEVLEDTARDYQVHRLPVYTYDLAKAFSAFYRDVQVLDAGDDEPRRLFIVQTAKNTLGNLLKLMGISAPERM